MSKILEDLNEFNSRFVSFRNQNHFVSYAYRPAGSGWKNWPTYLTPIELVQLPIRTVLNAQVSSNFDDLTTCWSSQSDNDEFLTINLGEILSIKNLSLVTRMMGYDFPIDFSVRARNDSLNFIYILNFTPIVDCLFSNPVEARYFQVLPVTYGTDDHGT